MRPLGPAGPATWLRRVLTTDGRSAVVVTAGNVASRLTGLLRVVVVGVVLGTTFLGNTYQGANLVSNVLFELLMAGMLASVLVPPLARSIARGCRADAERLAGAVLGIALAAAAVVSIAGILGRPWIMRALTVTVEDPGIRRQQIATGSYLLVLLLPQVILYAAGSVVTAFLHSDRRFAAAAFAPVANNLAVVATMAGFWALVGGGRPTLDLSAGQRLLLGGGTTAGVAAMTAVPWIALRRRGVALRPRWDPRTTEMSSLVRAGAWAACGLALFQLLVVTTLVLANRVEGAVVAYHIAFQAFLLPFALLAHPVMTAVYPRLAATVAATGTDDGGGVTPQDALGGPSTAQTAAAGARVLLFLLVPASAITALLGPGIARVIELGAIDAAGVELVGRLVSAYSLGLVGYAGLHYLTRAFYAVGDARTPAVVMGGVAGGGSLLMVAGYTVAGHMATAGSSRVVAVAAAHSAACLAGAGAMLVLWHRRVGSAGGSSVAVSGGRCLVASVPATVSAWAVIAPFGNDGEIVTLASVMIAGALAAWVYWFTHRVLDSPELEATRSWLWRRAPAARA